MKASQAVRRYVLSHPSIRDCLQLGLVNHSALARRICDELKIESFDAVLAGIKRFPVKAGGVSSQDAITRIISQAQLKVTSRIAVLVAARPRDPEKILSIQSAIRKKRGRCLAIESDEVVTLIISQQYLSLVQGQLRNLVLSVTEHLAIIQVVLDKQVEETPGVVAYFYGLLAFHGINVREEASCWTDILLVVDERDLSRTLLALESVSA
jgi:aspartokinase